MQKGEMNIYSHLRDLDIDSEIWQKQKDNMWSTCMAGLQRILGLKDYPVLIRELMLMTALLIELLRYDFDSACMSTISDF